MKIKTMLTAIFGSFIFITGCTSIQNPLGVGYEHSSCESSKNGGVCGSPMDIYKYRDKIRKVKRDYLASGLDKTLFFSITPNGDILVKDKRNGNWMNYDRSPYKKIIDARVNINKTYSKYGNNTPSYDKSIDVGVPVSKQSDLSIQYAKQAPMVETRTNVGRVARTNGKIQKIWIAPTVSKDGDLVSAHEIYAVTEKPKWNVGEATPKSPRKPLGSIPTPISNKLKAKQQTVSKKTEKIIRNYNNDNLHKADAVIDKFTRN